MKTLQLLFIAFLLVSGNPKLLESEVTQAGYIGDDCSFSSACPEEPFSAKFDFGESAFSLSPLFECAILSPCAIGCEASNAEGIFASLSGTDGVFHVSLVLPEEDGSIEFLLFDGKRSRSLFLYSSFSDNRDYYISSVAMSEAKRAAGTLPNQTLFDGDIPSRAPSDDDFEQNRVIASGRVHGTLTWKDDGGNVRPLVNAKVKLTFDASYGTATDQTGSDGSYDIQFAGIWTLSSFACTIHVYPENSLIKVANSSGTIYEYAELLSDMSNGDDKLHSKTFEPASDNFGQAMSIFQGLTLFAQHAQTLVGSQTIPQCQARYPVGGLDGASFLASQDLIEIGDEAAHSSSSPNMYAAWDMHGHEYGHFLQHQYFYQNYNGFHPNNFNNIEGYFIGVEWGYITGDDANLTNAQIKERAMGLSFKEAWATFFAIISEKSFPSAFSTFPTIQNNQYDPGNGAVFYAESFTYKDGDFDERTVLEFLFHLWDSTVDYGKDLLSISEQNLWNIMVSSNPEFLGDFVSAILSSSISFNRSDFGLLLESLNLSSTAIIRSFVGNRPKFSWTPGGTNVPENGITFSLAFDKFDLVIYDANQSAVISKNNLTSATCILSLSETNLLSLAYGSYYFVAVKAYDSFEVLSGGYPCHWYQFSK